MILGSIIRNASNFLLEKKVNILIFMLGLIVSIICANFSYFLGFNQNLQVFNISAREAKPFIPLMFEDNNEVKIHTYQEVSDLEIRRSEISQPPPSNSEILSTLNVASELKKAGKYDKAMKVIQRSVALAPSDPEVLNSYGEFLEDIDKNVIAADQMYLRALLKCPSHKKALMNRERTSPIVENLDRETFDRIDEKRNRVAAIPETNIALCRAKKESYYQHIYHTVGLEGNTMSLSQTRSIVETKIAIGGKSIAEHNEILGLDSAMKYINATLVNRLGRIGLDDILEIHRRVLGNVDPTECGIFRRTQVFVGGHVPPGPGMISTLMEDFTNWLNSDLALSLHPIQLASLAHYKLVDIHPFVDGNGRTARLLMNMILMQAGFPPVIIPKNERQRYYHTLEIANMGEIRPFIRFIAECTEKTLNLFLWSTMEYPSQNLNIPALDNIIIN